MPKFRIEVKIKAECDYTVEVEAETEHDAEDIATGMWRQMLPSDFEVSKGYITDWDVESTDRLTYVCERCGIEYPAEVETAAPIATNSPQPLKPWKEDSDYCEMCGPIIEAEEKAEDDALAARIAARRANLSVN